MATPIPPNASATAGTPNTDVGAAGSTDPQRHSNGSSSPVPGQDETSETITGDMRPTPTPAPDTVGVRSTRAPQPDDSGAMKSVKSTNGVKTSSVTSSPSKG